MSVFCTGEALIDMICSDKGSSLKDGLNFVKKPGGAPMNVAAAIGALGGKVSVCGMVGKDPFGDQLISVLRDFKVNIDFLFQSEEHFTTFAFVSLMLDGERDFVFNRDADEYLSMEDLKDLKIENETIFHFGSATAFLGGDLEKTYYALLEKAVENKKIISFDPNYRHLLFSDKMDLFVKHSKNFLAKADFSKLSDEEAYLITGKNDLNEAAKELFELSKGVFTITLGKEGTLLGLNGETHIIPTNPIKAVDTTGAGDAFVGAMLYQLDQIGSVEGLGLKDWTNLTINANKAGAKTCLYLGAMEAFKNLNHSIFE